MQAGDELIYEERLSSKWTQVLFVVLTAPFLLYVLWRLITIGADAPSVVVFCLFAFFLFYSINYRMLVIRLTRVSLKLAFGIFRWTIPLENIGHCQLDDELPLLLRFGGAGIHFMWVHGRYRVSFNFLEYPRVVIRLKKRTWLIVRDVSFSTRRPTELVQLIRGLTAAMGAE